LNKRALGADGLLLLTAAIWGFGFVAQRSGMEYVGPFAYNGIRFILGSLSLFPIIAWQKHRTTLNPSVKEPRRSLDLKKALPGIFAAGSIIFFAVTFQQLGIMFTTAGNAGFITGLYVVLTPVFGIFLGRKTGKATWIGAVFTLTGLYFISVAGSGPAELNPGDVLVAIGAIFWACHVLIIDRLVQKTDPIILSSGQFMICGLISLAAAFLAEPVLAEWLNSFDTNSSAGMIEQTGLIEWTPLPALLSGLSSGRILVTKISGAIIPILYGGLASVGIAYTLQVVAQRNAPPAHATIILCLEGCFAAFGGVIILHEPLGTWTILGFALMLTGMLVSQWETILKKEPRMDTD
jgi:drug/metabolite transporter (DMT)-like permease